MTAASWIIFGPDLEPLETEARWRAEAPGPRTDGLMVAGEPAQVARALAQAADSGDGWCELERVSAASQAPQPVHVQARHVRYVIAASPDPA